MIIVCAKDEIMSIWLITGFLILTGCAEAAHLITIMTNKSLQTYTLLCMVFAVAGLLVYAGFLYWGVRKGKVRFRRSVTSSRKWNWGMLTFLAVFLLTAYHFCSGYVPQFEDATYEIVLGNLKSGGIMTVHPFLGTETEAAMPIRMRILGLSSIYSALITISQQSPFTIMCKMVPFTIWALSMLVYWAFSKELFSDSAEKRWIFISMVALVYLATSGGDGMVGYRLFYSGFSGETIRAAVLVPYTVYVSWQKRWFLAGIAVLAEICLVWTTFGVGYCLLIAVSMFLVHWFLDRRGRHAA
jgi:hypothetical protein